MDRTDIIAKLTPIFHDVFEDETIIVSDEIKADDIEAWDSLTHVMLIVTIEKEFTIKFTSREIASLDKVKDLIDLIIGKLA